MAVIRNRKPSSKSGPPERTPPKRSPLGTSTPAKKYSVISCSSESHGEKVLIYADTGMGKSTLASLSPKPVFLSLDEGIEKLKHPVTGEPLKKISGLETFEDVRGALGDIPLFDEYETIVVDTSTKLQDIAEDFVVRTIPTEKGAKVKDIIGYGYNKGYKHLYNTMKLVLQDCDALIHHGKNVILIAQAITHNVANPSGEDFLRSGPRLHKDKSWDIEALYCEWSDHILRIDYQDLFVKDKKISGDAIRNVFVKPEVYFRAKSRTISESVITFKNQQDDSLWKFLFTEEN